MNNRDLISQYVDTGLKISEYQFNKLSNNNKETYLRKRVMATKNAEKEGHGSLAVLKDYEFILLNDKLKHDYIYNAGPITIGNMLMMGSKSKIIDTEQLINYILKIRGTKEYNNQIFCDILQFSSDKELLINNIINLKGDTLNRGDIACLLHDSTNKVQISKRIIELGKGLDVIKGLHAATDEEAIKIIAIYKQYKQYEQ